MMNLSREGKVEKKESKEEKQRKRWLKRYLLEKMQAWINGLLEAERDEFWGRGRHEPLSGKEGNYRNGYRRRGINFLGLGRIELRVLRDGKGEFSSAWLPERKGQDPEVEAFRAEVFGACCSTRDWAGITEKPLGQKYDSKQISRIVVRASQDLETGRLRRLEGREYKFLSVDGANFAVGIKGRVSRESFCAVLGVSEEGPCFEVLALERGDRERTD